MDEGLKLTGIAAMRHLLLNGAWTKKELETKTGLKASTVQVQLSSHLKKNFEVVKSSRDGRLLYSMRPKEAASVCAEALQKGVEDFPGLEPGDVKHATDEDLKELEEAKDDLSGGIPVVEGYGDPNFEPVPGMPRAYRMRRTNEDSV